MAKVYRISADDECEPTYGRCARCEGLGVIGYDPRRDEMVACPDCWGKGWQAGVLN